MADRLSAAPEARWVATRLMGILFGGGVVEGGSATVMVTAVEFTTFAKYLLCRGSIDKFGNGSVPAVSETIVKVKYLGVSVIVAAPRPVAYVFLSPAESVTTFAIGFTLAITASSLFVPSSM